MKYISFFALLSFLFLIISCKKDANHQKQIALNNNWSFRQTGDKVWLPATVPGCVHTDLLQNQKIDDPFYRLNEHDLQWIDKEDWEYRNVFVIDQDIIDKEMIEIYFNGLDTYADVYLNDHLILKANNMFREWNVDVKEYINKGENELMILFKSPILAGIEKLESLNYTIPVSGNDLSQLGGAGDKKVSIFTRKAAYHFGWDWGPRLVTSGIWRPVKLLAWNKATIRDLFVQQKAFSTDRANLIANIEIETTSDQPYDISISVNSQEVLLKEYNLKAGSNLIEIPFNIINPELWWPNGMGDQTRYDIEIRINRNKGVVSRKSVKIGLRTVEVVRESDSIGTSFYLKVNGFPVFMKGVNSIPLDAFPSRVSKEQYKHILSSARDANMNMIRVWGGGIYEDDLFYDLCDQYGLLVWQDFMFACSMYPGDDQFLENVKQEGIDNIKRLRNHPCIALWCGNNENLSAWYNWGWKNDVIETQGKEIADTIWKAYKDLFHELLPEMVKKYDGDRLYWSSSPSADMGITENYQSGDVHYWMVWWGKEPFSKYREAIPRFMSEYGFQSFPELNTVKKYSLPEDWDINSEVMKSHQRSSIGNVTIKEYMLRDYKEPEDFPMFLYVNHILQAEGIKTAIESHRKNMPYCMGSLYWQLNDVWPVASWSGIDYFGNWKALHYTVKKAFRNVSVIPEINEDNVEIYIVSDSLQNITAILNVNTLDMAGTIIRSSTEEVKIKSNSSQLYDKYKIVDILHGKSANDILLRTWLETTDGMQLSNNTLYFVPPKDLNLSDPEIHINISPVESGFKIGLTSDVLAKNIYLSAEFEGHFSDNYFDLLPGESVYIYFAPKTDIEFQTFEENLRVVSLFDSF